MFKTISNWLSRHSTSIERVGNEIRFIHSGSRTSLLVVKDKWPDGLIPVQSEKLRGFFDEGLAASIGNGQIIIGSSIDGGIEVSHGFRIPDLSEMRSNADDFGIDPTDNFEIFMIEASWMFFYGVDLVSQKLFRFDRDFGTSEAVSSIENVLDDWWQMVLNDESVEFGNEGTNSM
jgi:hypothetical protein